MLNEKDYMEMAATIFAGMMQNNGVEVMLEQDSAGEVHVLFKTKNFSGATNAATIMSSIVKGLKNTDV
ncbi:MAG: hypothetical protein NC238_02350 [Dehalobacter sp.]|nr:hypothetical protein [Dehalobacter sp.]